MKKWTVISLAVIIPLTVFAYYTYTYWGWFGGENYKKPVFSISQDPDLVSLLYSLNISKDEISNLALEYVTTIAGVPVWVEGQAQNYYRKDGSIAYSKISIKENMRNDSRKTVLLAHEYLHYVWDTKLNKTTQDEIAKSLNETYNRDVLMQERTKKYVDNNKLVASELFAFYCTERINLPKMVADNCHIDRTKLKLN